MHDKPNVTRLAAPALALLLAACGGDGSGSGTGTGEPMRFEVGVTNLTAGQPLSPVAVVVHEPDYAAFEVGASASTALEQLAEGGDNSDLLAAAEEADSVSGTASGAGPIAPGASETVTVESPAGEAADRRLSVVSMLVNTNDALAAVDGVDLSGLATGDSMTVNGGSYDSGTEANTETAGTMPGPAASGGAREGFNTTRDDVRDAVHAAVLGARHRWDDPVVRVTITRIQ